MIAEIRLDTNLKRQAKTIVEIGTRYYFDKDGYQLDMEPFRREMAVEKEDEVEKI